jgi:hypothetical protein
MHGPLCLQVLISCRSKAQDAFLALVEVDACYRSTPNHAKKEQYEEQSDVVRTEKNNEVN